MFSKFKQIGKNTEMLNDLQKKVNNMEGQIDRIGSKISVLKNELDSNIVSSKDLYTVSNNLDDIKNKLKKIKDVL